MKADRPAAGGPAVPADLVELGYVASAYGVKGWIKVQPHSAQADALLGAGQWWLQAPQAPLEQGGVSSRPFAAHVVAARRHGASVVAQLRDSSARDEAEKLKGCSVWVPRSDFPPAEPDEYYWVDLIGCELYGEHEGESVLIGKVAEVIDNGAHGVLRVARMRACGTQAEFLRDGKGRIIDMLVPFVQAHVHTVDLANKRLDSNWPAEF